MSEDFEELDFDVTELEEKDIEEVEEEDTDEEDYGGLIGFKIKRGDLTKILNHIQSSGTTSAGSKVNFIDDCIIRVEDNCIWIVAVDSNYSIIPCAKVDVNNDKDHKLKTLNIGEIPIDIDKIIKYSGRFNSNDVIEFIYENGMIVIRKTRTDIDFPIKVEAYIQSIRKATVKNDLLIAAMRKYKKLKTKRHANIINFVKRNKGIYIKNDDKITIYDGTELEQYIEISCDQLKEVVRDGDLLDNRLYPFTVSNKSINIISKSTDKSTTAKLSRDLFIKKGNFSGNYTNIYPNQFNAAVSTTRGHVKLFFGNKKPLLLLKQSEFDYGLDLCCIVSRYPDSK